MFNYEFYIKYVKGIIFFIFEIYFCISVRKLNIGICSWYFGKKKNWIFIMDFFLKNKLFLYWVGFVDDKNIKSNY